MIGAARLTDEGSDLLPAVRHVDGTTRPQLLRAGDEDFVWAVLDALAQRGHPRRRSTPPSTAPTSRWSRPPRRPWTVFGGWGPTPW